MNPSEAPPSVQFKVGVFTVVGLLLVGLVTVYVNDKPYWWRPCQLVRINVDDATGLKTKSPIRSLGLEIGYLKSVDLSETHVTLGICITAPVEVLPTTRAYIRGEGFLGDKFVELKPVKYTGKHSDEAGPAPADNPPDSTPTTPPSAAPDSSQDGRSPGSDDDAGRSKPFGILDRVSALLEPSAYAEESAHAAEPLEPDAEAAPKSQRSQREIPVGEQTQDVQQLVNRVDSLVNEMTGLTNNLKTALNPTELKETMQRLNTTLENASRTLSPEGGLNQTAQRTLAKLEDAIEQLRDMLTRVNKGEGSVGMLLNDPTYAEEIHEAIQNVNRLLSKVSGVRFVIDIGASELPAYSGGRGWFQLGIWPKQDRYYLIGISVDPRGRVTDTNTVTTTGNASTTVSTETVETTGILITAMLGKVFWRRLDLAAGALYGDGAISVALNLGPHDREDMFRIKDDVYSREGSLIDDRATAIVHPLPWFPGVYAELGLESIRRVNNQLNYFYGAGLTFDDEDIKVLFALR